MGGKLNEMNNSIHFLLINKIMEDKVFTSLDLCRFGHTEFIYTQRVTLCKKCSHIEILKQGFLIKGCMSKDIDRCITTWLHHKFSQNAFDFLKIGFARALFEKYFPERLDNSEYCQNCGDLFYHGKECQCYQPGCSI